MTTVTHCPTIGIIGGGQLGRMLTLAAQPLGFQVVVVDPGENCPAAQVGARQIVGDLYDPTALKKLTEAADFITIEIEHLDAAELTRLAGLGKPINPAPATISLIQDKFKQKEFLRDKGIAVAPFVKLTRPEDAQAALDNFGGKMLIKTRYGAYDGRGNMVVASDTEIFQAFERFNGQLLYAEKFVPFERELAVMVARDMSGNSKIYPIVQTIHERNICTEVLAPAPIDEAAISQAHALAERVAEVLDGAGMFGIEMFLATDGEVLLNEIAPRVHNSGHYTMDASRTSQFEQHIRAISGLPLGDTAMTAPAAVMVNILGERAGPTALTGLTEALAIPGVSVHLYGKSPTKIDRKMGHINATADTLQEAQQRAEQARKLISI